MSNLKNRLKGFVVKTLHVFVQVALVSWISASKAQLDKKINTLINARKFAM